MHTEPRWLEDWNEAGWDEVYRQCARLLRSRPRLLGLVATAWFYDPQLAAISPHLGYCRERLLERGRTYNAGGYERLRYRLGHGALTHSARTIRGWQIRTDILHPALAPRTAAAMG